LANQAAALMPPGVFGFSLGQLQAPAYGGPAQEQQHLFASMPRASQPGYSAQQLDAAMAASGLPGSWQAGISQPLAGSLSGGGTSPLDSAALHLLLELRRLDAQERPQGQPLLPRAPRGLPPRRLVGGTREVRKMLRDASVAVVLLARDAQDEPLPPVPLYDAAGNCVGVSAYGAPQPGETLRDIVDAAAAASMPAIRALDRATLGGIFRSGKRMSTVAVCSAAGVEAALVAFLQVAASGAA
jgi:hypothetical protein